MSTEKVKPVIKIKDLDVIYFPGKTNEIRAVRDISLEIYPGEFIIFFGPSGCGKSTLLYAISGLETAIKGDIFIENYNISKMSERQIEKLHQSTMGMIFQAYYLINSLNVLQNITLPQVALNIEKKKREKKALELANRFGVGPQAKKLPNELSGGQQQRVAICRALINDPEIVLADEPTGNLDSASAEEFMVLIKQLNQTQKKTVILVTHNPTYLDMAHRVFYIKDGAIVKEKVNEYINEKVKIKKDEEGPSISKDLELLAKTFSSIGSSVGNLLIPFKAKQIASEVLTGMSLEEISKIENKIQKLLISGFQNPQELQNTLDISIEKGGLGLDKRTAKKLSDKITSIVNEIKELEEEERRQVLRQEEIINAEAVDVCDYLIKTFSLKFRNDLVAKVFESAVKQRLSNKIDRQDFEVKLDLPTKKGGVGLDKRTAVKVAKRLELLILGKYK